MNTTIRKFLISFNLYNSALRIKSYLSNDLKSYINFYAQFIKQGSLCFDVGANIGQRTKVFLKMNCTTIAIEPQLSCFKTLQQRFGNNRNVKLINNALGSQRGVSKMFISESHELSSLSSEWIDKVQSKKRFKSNWKNTIEVQVTTLDDIIKECGTPDFVKIDVEGYEYEVVSGLSNPLKMISLEFTPECIINIKKCVDHLRTLGEISINFCFSNKPCDFVLSNWACGEKIDNVIEVLGMSKNAGDIYIRTL